ncbi:uncharacterized protein LOC103310830 [Acyrthosiphon pisum]|uniref:DNA-directed DNA polymerase n=1 Tax=Acyrthosiphon pisum TaxID=7029 RepID=A0A8R2FEA4_ACYPI|nr:uncharacterized protein LOC103310830 [Acyrthosiphon pisum]|eukprot:XP_008188430.1 PREDICTED: uncharacterized protein LOC103310830 [Acyrthosiphon pisum]
MTTENNKTHINIADLGICPYCKSKFNDNNLPVRDHNHLTGQYRHTVCNNCNLKMQQPKFVPCFFHNLSGYDSHFLITQLGYDTQSINVIPNTEEKFISFTKYISNTFKIRFVDTYRFMASKLENLSTNLARSDMSKFRETTKIFGVNDLDLVTRKGFYPYKYTDSWEKLNETNLPPKEHFYNSLTEEHILNEHYDHSMEVWNRFNCNTLGQYSDVYLKVDVMLLVDIFENFRELCLETYGLDANYYFTAPGMSFDCMLKYTGVELSLLSDYDKILMMEAGIKGGLTQAVKRYAKANNVKVSDYDPSKPDLWIVYLDATNLGWICMEVDVSHPCSLHDDYNDLPYLPERIVPRGSKIKKLVANLDSKKNYVVHYLALKQALKAGLILEKVHRVLKFNQSPWLAKYIDLNTTMRKIASNDFERDFFKLMNNAVFGKTMENVRNRMKMELVSDDKKCAKLINRPTFKNITIYNENLAAIHLEIDELKFDKPIYGSMKHHFGKNIKLMYMDTDSLVYTINSKDFYNDLRQNRHLLERMDRSNLPTDHLCYCADRKKVPGTFTDETHGNAIHEFVALRAKAYAYNLAGVENIKAKGVRGHVVKNHITMEDYKKYLFWDGPIIDNEQAR